MSFKESWRIHYSHSLDMMDDVRAKAVVITHQFDMNYKNRTCGVANT